MNEDITLCLPDELILKIFSYLSVPELCKGSLVCRRFLATSKADSLWKQFAKRDFGISDKQLWDGWLNYDFYRKVLHRFRYLTGWWRRAPGNAEHYGGVYRVEIEADGINGYEYLPPLDGNILLTPNLAQFFGPNSPFRQNPQGSGDSGEEFSKIDVLPASDFSSEGRRKWRRHKLFSLTHVGQMLRTYCYQSDIGLADGISHRTCQKFREEERHECEGVSCRDEQFLKKTDNGFQFNCYGRAAHSTINLNYWFELEHGIRVRGEDAMKEILIILLYDQYYQCRIKKFELLERQCESFDLIPFSPISSSSEGLKNNLFPPGSFPATGIPSDGIFFGTYAAHGWEVSQWTYRSKPRADDTEEVVMEAWKVTGDPNIPENCLTVRVFLEKPLMLDGTEDYEDIAYAIDDAYMNNFDIDTRTQDFQNQPFGYPEDSYAMEKETLPKFCRGRYLAEGQVAGPDFHNPSLTQCVFALFDPGFFAVLWTELKNLSIFYRVDEQPSGKK